MSLSLLLSDKVAKVIYIIIIIYIICLFQTHGMVWYGMVFIYSTSLYIIYIAHHYNITQDAEREMHEVQYLYLAFP